MGRAGRNRAFNLLLKGHYTFWVAFPENHTFLKLIVAKKHRSRCPVLVFPHLNKRRTRQNIGRPGSQSHDGPSINLGTPYPLPQRLDGLLTILVVFFFF